MSDLEADTQLFELLTEMQASAPSPIEDLSTIEKRQVLRALREAGGNRQKAAKLIGISRATIFRKIREYGLE